MTNDQSLLKKFNKIIDSETARAQATNEGITDVATVAKRVKLLCKPFLDSLLMLLGEISFNSIIGKRMKRKVQGLHFRRQSKNRPFNPPGAGHEQLVFEGMEQFQGYPSQLTYEDKPGHVVFVDSRQSRDRQRDKAEEYLELLLEWDKQRIKYLKTGNRFARELVKAYGDLPLEALVERWKQDHRSRESGG